MSETQVGILTGLPQVLFACTAVIGSLLIARFGALATLIAGLFATAAGSALRGFAPDIALLYAATIVTGFGVAIMQPSLPPLVRTWLPHRIGFGTAVFTNGLLVGEILPVALTIPLLLPLARRQLACELHGLGGAGRADRARHPAACAARHRRSKARPRNAGGRTGATR